MTDRPQFDIASWMRLISDVQQLGLDTARSVAERFADMADTSIGGAAGTQPVDSAIAAWRKMFDTATDSDTQQQLTAAAQAMTDSMLGMMRAAWDFFSDTAVGAGAMAWGGGGAADLGSAPAGGSTSGTVYVHVGRDSVPDEVKVRVGEMVTGHGETLPPEAFSFEPASIDTPEAGRSYSVKVTVAVPEGSTPGSYHGHFFADTEPPRAVPVSLVVES